MNDPLIDSLRLEQNNLRRQFEAISRRIDALAEERERAAAKPPVITPPPVAAAPASTPHSEPEPQLEPATVAPAPLPTPLPYPEPPPIPAPSPTSLPQPVGHREESFELEVGRVWLVRIGIALFLTGLIFLGNFAYDRFIDLISPMGRAAGLFLASMGLLGLGTWIERSRETMRQYGRILAAGGLAGGYYAIYASYFVHPLHWIDNPSLAGVLLMAWAVLIVGTACKRRSQTLGVASILLAYYTSILQPSAAFTNLSDAILAGASIFLTVRYGWKVLSYAALAATYGIALFEGHVGFGTLAIYWLVFSMTVLWPGVANLETEERITLLTLNNAAFLLLGSMHLPAQLAHGFSTFCLAFGGVLAATSLLSRAVHSEIGDQETAYFIEGVLCATLGWINRWNGDTLPLLLAAESALLLFASAWRHGIFLRVLAAAAAIAAAVTSGFDYVLNPAPQPAFLSLSLIFGAETAGAAWAWRQDKANYWLAPFFALFALGFYTLWFTHLTPESEWAWIATLSGGVLYVSQIVRPSAFVRLLATVFWGAAFLLFLFAYPEAQQMRWVNGVAIAGMFLLEVAAARLLPEEELDDSLRAVWISLVCVAGWRYVSVAFAAWQPACSQTLIWAGFAVSLLGLGLALRERAARWFGLLILAAALARVGFVDAWQWDSLSRIVAFLGLGALLLVLGFAYNRYHDTIKKWL